MRRLFSDEQLVALSKVFDIMILAAASAQSALSSTITATLPAPTPSAGVPLEYPARTLACEPVTTTRSHCFINWLEVSLVTGFGSICTRSSGAPMRLNSAWMYSTSFVLVDTPLGEGDEITALPHFSALIMLLAGVAPGLVEGTTAHTTPTGRAISVMPVSGISRSTPVEIAPCRSRRRP